MKEKENYEYRISVSKHIVVKMIKNEEKKTRTRIKTKKKWVLKSLPSTSEVIWMKNIRDREWGMETRTVEVITVLYWVDMEI